METCAGGSSVERTAEDLRRMREGGMRKLVRGERQGGDGATRRRQPGERSENNEDRNKVNRKNV